MQNQAYTGGPWKLFNLLSFDVVIGAIAGGVIATKILNVNPGWSWWIVLAASVWLVYTTDHLIDGLKTGTVSGTERHLFHYLNRKSLLIALLIVALATAVIAFGFLDTRIIIFGIIAGGLTLSYLAIIYFSKGRPPLRIHKELLIAILYTAGIWGGPVILRAANLTANEWIVIILFLGLALLDLLILSYYEIEQDTADNHPSWAVHFGKKKTYDHIVIIAVLIAFGIVSLITTATANLILAAAKILIPMLFMLLIIFYQPEIFKQKNAYRYLCEVVFWIPFLLLMT